MTKEELLEKEDLVRKNGLLQFRKYDKYLQESIQNNKVIFGAAKNFNDPWDCNLPIKIPNPEEEIFEFLKQANEEGGYGKSKLEIRDLAIHYSKTRNELETQLRNEININRRFTCFNIFSKKQVFGNSLFWANYANKHSGICMKFKGEIIEAKKSFYCESKEFISSLPIEYCKEIPEFNYLRYRLGTEMKSPVQYYFGTKSIEWKYEREVRFIYENYSSQIEEYPQVQFDVKLLEKVYLGCNLKEDEISQICEMFSSNEYQHVGISRMIRSEKSFNLVEQKIQ